MFRCIYSIVTVLFCTLLTNSSFASQPTVLQYKLIEFILVGTHGTVKPAARATGKYLLTLKGIDKNAVFFVNAPNRLSGTMLTRTFLKRWIKPPPHDWKTEPPNGAITVITPRTTRSTVATLILADPIYDEKAHTLQFTVQPLESPLRLPRTFTHPIVTLPNPVVCGVIGSWGDLPGEEKYNIDCHQAQQKKG